MRSMMFSKTSPNSNNLIISFQNKSKKELKITFQSPQNLRKISAKSPQNLRRSKNRSAEILRRLKSDFQIDARSVPNCIHSSNMRSMMFSKTSPNSNNLIISFQNKSKKELKITFQSPQNLRKISAKSPQNLRRSKNRSAEILRRLKSDFQIDARSVPNCIHSSNMRSMMFSKTSPNSNNLIISFQNKSKISLCSIFRVF